MKLRQCLFNLVSNAAKFTERGMITLAVTREWHGDQEWVLFAVRDTGIGMKPEEVGRIFEAFAQADAQVSSKYGGSGLGPDDHRAVLRAARRQRDGREHVRRGHDLHHPPARGAAGGASSGRATGRAGRTGRRAIAATVLIIDDDPSVHDLVRRALARQDIQVLVARTGEQGSRWPAGYRPQAIILDVIMQRMDGWHVLAPRRWIRSCGASR